jgi:hypothetical protein
LYKILYYYIREVVEFKDLYIYTFFPKLVLEEGQAITFLIAKQEELWLNRAFLPAITTEYNYKDAVL